MIEGGFNCYRFTFLFNTWLHINVESSINNSNVFEKWFVINPLAKKRENFDKASG